eukprot:JP442053.1.p3 GENE.JP442053.1~~JP442053.1.p3  ORF type:complete len:58 (-),score=4.04 JP442053.1:18-191(-)
MNHSTHTLFPPQKICLFFSRVRLLAFLSSPHVDMRNITTYSGERKEEEASAWKEVEG